MVEIQNITLRHTLATLAYRAAKALRGMPPELADFRAAGSSRSPVEILAHMGDLFDWALSIARGKTTWKDAVPLPWEQEVERFFAALARFDEHLADPASPPLEASTLQRLFQGPVADALTHTGQIAMLRRLAGSPVTGENYFVAHIEVGRIHPGTHYAPVREF